MNSHTRTLAVVDTPTTARTVLREAGSYATCHGTTVDVRVVLDLGEYERRRHAHAAIPALARREYALDATADATHTAIDRLARDELTALGVPYTVRVHVGARTRALRDATAGDYDRAFVATTLAPRTWLARRRDQLSHALAGRTDPAIVHVDTATAE